MRGIFMAVLFLGLIAGGIYLIDPSTTISTEEAVREDLRANTSPEDLGNRVNTALETGDFETAVMYGEIAEFAGFELPKEAADALYEASGITATIGRTGIQLVSGFVTGESESMAGLTGAVASDLTVVGDLRDISSEGPKFLAGEPYNELILGLSVVGVGVTGATVASGGGGLPGRVGVSLMKVAVKTGNITVDFARVMGRLVGDAVNFPALRETLRTIDLSNTPATREALTAYARTINTAKIAPVLTRMNDVRRNAGAPESVRLMRYVDSTEDLEDIADMSSTLGRKTRGVIEITGKTSLRAFRTTLRLLEFILENILAFLSFLGSIFVAITSRILRRVASSAR